MGKAAAAGYRDTVGIGCPTSDQGPAGHRGIDEQNRSVPPIESIPKTGMTGRSKHGPRRSDGAERRSYGAETYFELSMQTI